ncbi:hypothetical protein NDU88_000116 [Pleurodeles waltl]|uniref:Uncharacterized protein n=1 Tax=Pleurodeles waltl TaxID=8319 RepID=A0AAV7SVL2_PLEWA|nr:hypothetical protein NDU88_000111 [Pleurodeles waltl]KAJ1168167.1 hypothetical protein NDU88_000116 [Pleurodeles waltl]
MEVMAGRRTVKEPELGFSGGRCEQERRRRGEKDQEYRGTQELEVPSVPIGDERRVKSRTTVGPLRKKTKSQSPGGGIHWPGTLQEKRGIIRCVLVAGTGVGRTGGGIKEGLGEEGLHFIKK